MIPAHPIECERKCEGCKNAAPERIELPAGYWIGQHVQGTYPRAGYVNYHLIDPKGRQIAMFRNCISNTDSTGEKFAKAMNAAAQPEAVTKAGNVDWSWLVGKEFYLGTVEEVSGDTASMVRGDDHYRIRISELLEEQSKRPTAEADLAKAREIIAELVGASGDVADNDITHMSPDLGASRHASATHRAKRLRNAIQCARALIGENR